MTSMRINGTAQSRNINKNGNKKQTHYLQTPIHANHPNHPNHPPRSLKTYL